MDTEKLTCHLCGKKLSRKQTLKTHLSCMHDESVSPAKKKYKVYESNPCAEIPTSTRYRWKNQVNTSDVSPIPSDLDEGEAFPKGLSNEEIHEADLENFDQPIQTSYVEADDDASIRMVTIDSGPEVIPGIVSFEDAREVIPGIVSFEDATEVIPGIVPLDEGLIYELDIGNIKPPSEDADAINDFESDMENESCHESSSRSNSDESDEEHENKTDCVSNAIQSAPLFVLPPSSDIYKSDITHYEHMLAVSAIATSGNLSSMVFQNVLDMLKLHIPDKNLCEENVHDLKKKLGFDKDYLKHYEYCSVCGSIFQHDNIAIKTCRTAGCGGVRSNKVYFVVGDVTKQIKEIMEREDNWQNIQQELKRSKTTTSSIVDITSGGEYRKMAVDGSFMDRKNNNVTLTFNTDGVNLFKSTNVSLWPIYLAINELPPRERFLKKNLIIWGIWQGPSKPAMNIFMGQFVRDMVLLERKGVQLSIGGEDIQCCAKIIVGTMDLPARACVLNTTHHNGAFSCIYCEHPGTVVKSGKGHARSFPYWVTPPKRRNFESITTDTGEAVLLGKTVKGINGKCAIGCLPGFSAVDNIVIDYMHACLAGITKRLIQLFTNGTSFKEDYFIGHKVPLIDKQLKSLCVPYLINRKPRRLSLYMKWKSSEFRSWLLYYSIPCLVNHLPNVYLKHYSCLVEGIHILLQSSITEEEIAISERLLNAFYKHAADLYGDNFLGLNVHNLSHLPDCVRKWGPLWAYSCFGFESANGEILKNIHGKKNVCSQIFWALQAQKRLQIENERLPEGKLKDFLRKTIFKKSGDNARLIDAFQCQIFPKITICDPATFTTDIQDQINQHLGYTSEDGTAGFGKAVKIKRNGFIFYSKHCQKVKSTNSYTITLEQPLDSGSDIVQVDYYLVEETVMKVYAVCSTFTATHLEIPRKVKNLRIVKHQRSNVVVPATLLKEHVVFMTVEGKTYVATFPNFVERD